MMKVTKSMSLSGLDAHDDGALQELLEFRENKPVAVTNTSIVQTDPPIISVEYTTDVIYQGRYSTLRSGCCFESSPIWGEEISSCPLPDDAPNFFMCLDFFSLNCIPLV